jgi:hypothetical protein
MARSAPLITVAQTSSSGNIASVHLEWQIVFDGLADKPGKIRLRGPNNFIREFVVADDTHFSTDIAGLAAGADVVLSVCSVFPDATELCSSTTVHTTGSPGGGGGPRPQPPAPRISSIEPHQATLHDEGQIVVHWTSANVDHYHFIFEGDQLRFTEVEIDSPGTTGFFVITPTFPGRKYSFKVQGCLINLIGSNNCSEFSPFIDTVMPQNTRSLREFLRLSNVQLNPGIRSLGPSTFSSGIRAMMRL